MSLNSIPKIILQVGLGLEIKIGKLSLNISLYSSPNGALRLGLELGYWFR